MIFLEARNTMYEFELSDAFIVLVVALFFGLGIYTLLKFRKNKDF